MRRNFLSLALLPIALTVLPAHNAVAQDQSQAANFPERPIRIVVPIVPGGTVDMVARLVAKHMAEEYGQPVIVENKSGASTLIGMRHVIQSPADGYTLLATANTLVSASEFVTDANYDPIKDFSPISMTVRVPMIFVTHPESGINNLADLVNKAKSDPESVTNASSGIGSTGYIAAELFSQQAGIQLTHVAYRGNAPALLDVMSGQVDTMFDQISTAGSRVQSGSLRALGVTTKSRSPMLPDVPSISELGYPDYEDVTYNAIVAPAGTPPEIINKLFQTITGIMAKPEVKETLAAQGIEAHTNPSPEDFGAFMQSQKIMYQSISATLK